MSMNEDQTEQVLKSIGEFISLCNKSMCFHDDGLALKEAWSSLTNGFRRLYDILEQTGCTTHDAANAWTYLLYQGCLHTPPENVNYPLLHVLETAYWHLIICHDAKLTIQDYMVLNDLNMIITLLNELGLKWKKEIINYE